MEKPTSAEMSSASNPANEPSPADTVNTPAITPAPPVQSFPFQSLAPLTIKLDRSNYPYWRSQALPALRAHDLEGYVLGTKHCPPHIRSFNPRGRGRGRGRTNNNRPICQLCSKPGHIASKCYHRFDISFQAPGSNQPQNTQNTNTNQTTSDQQAYFTTADAHNENTWYIDSGATNHTTADASHIQHKADLKGPEASSPSTPSSHGSSKTQHASPNTTDSFGQ
ncbi:hypothetical protein F8388_015234 [Cannabis sativa]|uniref:Retrotransposon Copia-like N-terminal domain-containing protein n=1 Tax=Cannabis sativa TaxID=3483 RepID=A0A7J6ECG7_CANSA|nr:hypothetical protein F8388_015234 [Cannabis sativa]